MGKNKERIIFFGSGDFPRHTFASLCEYNDNEGNAFEVVGLVTSNDKCEDKGCNLKEVAKDYNIPTIVVKDCKSAELEEWCRNLNPTLFVVISFKKIPSNLLSLVDNRAFNVHASMLPLLRGANPIRWAIRYQMKQTGLTAITLSDKIDCGDIIANQPIDIGKDDNYGSLRERMSIACVDFTYRVIMKQYCLGNSVQGIHQCDHGLGNDILYAPKLNIEYFVIGMYEDLTCVLRSVAPYGGIKCKLCVYKKTIAELDFCVSYNTQREKTYDCTIWGMHKRKQGEDASLLQFNTPVSMSDEYIIDEIQIEGKKRMKTKDFVQGFKYLKKGKNGENDNYEVYLNLY